MFSLWDTSNLMQTCSLNVTLTVVGIYYIFFLVIQLSKAIKILHNI